MVAFVCVYTQQDDSRYIAEQLKTPHKRYVPSCKRAVSPRKCRKMQITMHHVRRIFLTKRTKTIVAIRERYNTVDSENTLQTLPGKPSWT